MQRSGFKRRGRFCLVLIKLFYYYSMHYKLLLILFIIYLLAPLPATAAENTRYRVEILVLTHLRQAEQPREELRIEDYSSALDFLTPPEEEQEDAPEEADASVPGAELDDEAATGAAGEAGLEAEPEEPDPNEVVHVEEMSDVMQEAWRRLRLSGPFRPEQYLSWEQGSEEPFPALRIHDLQIVWVDDPYADLRPDFEAQEGDKAPVFADAAGLDALGLESAPTLPDPKVHYRLDGSVVPGLATPRAPLGSAAPGAGRGGVAGNGTAQPLRLPGARTPAEPASQDRADGVFRRTGHGCTRFHHERGTRTGYRAGSRRRIRLG